jgi:SAM-dependent methyltransferase
LPGADPAVLARWRAGEISAEIALVWLLLATPDPDRLRAALAEAGADALAQLLDANRAGIDRIALMIRSEAESAGEGDAIARWRGLFDRFARIDPEAGVALYSLGDKAILAAATEEIVALLRRLGVLDPGRRVLEIGTGAGRVALAVAPLVAEVTGIDISEAMIEEARRRGAGVPNARFLVTHGRDLARFADGSAELVLAVDSFPYIVEAGEAVLAEHFREAARVLAPDSDFVILNFSYRGDLSRDRADAARLAAGSGLALLRDGTRDLALWDGVTFHFGKPG